MTKAIFTVKADSGYDDRPEAYYHFPRTYLNQVRSTVGDYIIYYEPRRASGDKTQKGRQAYFAFGRVTAVVADEVRENHFYALISDYLDFANPVPFIDGGRYYERSLQKEDGSTNRGAFGRAVRPISDSEFDLIIKIGFLAEVSIAHQEPLQAGFQDAVIDFNRPIVEMTISRPFREQAFRKSVRSAYQNQCAVTGLCLLNGGGRPEVHAAHIQPVSKKGPDTIRNGIALSGTFHWLFDRGLISISDDYRILVAEKKVPDQVLNMLNRDGKLIIPNDHNLRPNPYYLKFHREFVFNS